MKINTFLKFTIPYINRVSDIWFMHDNSNNCTGREALHSKVLWEYKFDEVGDIDAWLRNYRVNE